MNRQQVTVLTSGHGVLISTLLLIFLFPLGVVYSLIVGAKWLIGSSIDWLMLGPIRRLR